jgi:GAF domain-containing protein/HAMP domain-containing protein
MNTPSQSSNQIRLNQNASAIVTVLLIVFALSALMFAYFGFINNLQALYIPVVSLTITVFIDLVALSLIRQERTNLAMLVVAIMFIINVLLAMLVVQGLGLVIAVTTILVVLAITSLAMTSNYVTPGVFVAVLFGILLYYADSFLSANRATVAQIEIYSPYLALAIVIPIFVVFVRQYNRFGLQAKITLGILLTAIMIVATLTFFSLGRAGDIVNSISEKYEASVTSETENQILSRVQTEANVINQIFAGITTDAINLAAYRSGLESQVDTFSTGSYWNATENLFQLSGGQVGNSATDVSSVFIPSTAPVSEDMFVDINTSVYLDFLAPTLLQTHPEVSAVYFISSSGYTIYYPNINLAQNVPADYDPRTDIFYSIATPEKNPGQLPVWTDAYQDSAGVGLIVTLSVPVYSEENKFMGIVGVDVQLEKISEIVSGIRLGDTDFAFLVDRDGFIISMPEEGYQLFGLAPQEIPITPLNRGSIFDTQSQILQFAAQRIIINETNLIDFPINDIQTYFAVANLPSTQYKLAIFAPTDELNAQILASRQEVQSEVQNSLQSASFIFIGLFIAALIVSFFVGQIITRPVKRLTNTVEQFAIGNLTARADVSSEDEAGVLARSFNAMAQNLRDTLTGLEERVAQRTQEVEKISASNAYRASQFESIARISRIISSTQTIDRLLPQIVQTISEEFDFYHVGIFLLDVHKEFAILAAANSEGGKRMLERSHRLRVGETGLVGFVTRSGQARVALDVGADAVFFNNPDLPETSSEIALPLRIGADIFGALDVQSTKTNAFSEEDVNILSVLADQVSIAIQNARSHQQSREALEQAELSAAQMIEQQWSQFLNKQNITQYHFDGVEAEQAAKSNEKQGQNLAIPLILRGAKIGTLKLSTADPNRIWDEDEIAIAQATAERTALAIENARLLSEAQKRATKERTIGKVSSKIGNSISLESILKTTIQELGNTLPGAEIAIQFTSDSHDPK